MKKFFIIISLFIFSSLLAQESKVYLVDIEGTIDLGLSPYIKRAVEEAETASADAIVFRINTFGGRVDAATQIKDAILNSEVKTIAFIDKRAISAGSLIALSCQNIVMVPGASMGATTVVDQTGKKQAEKAQSYMRSEMRATAERNGRPTKIAEAMVDERIVVEGLVDSTQLVTLTSKEAVKWGMADTVISNLNDLLSAYNFEKADIVKIKTNWAEDFLRFLQNPIITSILLMIGMVGFFAEVKSPGWGLPGTAAVIALGLFFGAHYILELASMLEILLFILGVVLIIVELFVVPGFGITGLLGIICIIASLFMGLLPDFEIVSFGLVRTALIQLAITFVLTGVFIGILIKFLPKTRFWSNLVLDPVINSQSGYSLDPTVKSIVGMKGIALTDLRPAGTAIIDDKRIDVVSEGDYISSNSDLIVTAVQGSKVIVRVVKEEE